MSNRSSIRNIFGKAGGMLFSISFLIALSFITLRSIAPFVFPVYFVYIIGAVLSFIIFLQIDFDIISLFYKHFYVVSVFALVVTLIIGQVTRGAVRWIPLGPVSIQPTELVRPFLLLFFAKFLTERPANPKRILLASILFAVPFFLIWFQPSLGVAIITSVGFVGILFSAARDKRLVVLAFILLIVLGPVIWMFMKPYQKGRVLSLLGKSSDNSASSYNSVQSMISVGSGQFSGQGLGKGGQTQLQFLPEKHTDFIFASIAEELGFVGAGLLLLVTFFLLERVIRLAEITDNEAVRVWLIGVFFSFLVQIIIHVGMNMGMLPITGLPYPLVSYGGSSLVATMTTLGIVLSIKRTT